MNNKTRINLFILTVLLLSWIVQVVVFGKIVPDRYLIVYMFIPAIVAFIFFMIEKDPWRRQARLFTNPFTFKPVVFAALYPHLWLFIAGLLALIISLGRLSGGFFSTLLTFPYISAYVLAVITMLPTVFGEEYGWRGYLLPKLTDEYGKVKAAVITGLVWGVWHIPSYYIAYSAAKIGDPILLTVIGMAVVAIGSFPYAYCFYRSNGNILPCVLLHAVYDVSAVMIYFGTPRVAGLMAGNPGLFDIQWPNAMVAIFISGLAFVVFYVKRYGKASAKNNK